MISATIAFDCKDKLLAHHYELVFGPTFLAEWVAAPDRTDWLRESWDYRMKNEAILQEHYDYDIDEHGCRCPVMENSRHKLLIPDVTIAIRGD